MKNKKNILITVFLFAIVFIFINVYALEITNHGTGGHRLRFSFDENGYPVTSVKINGVDWVEDTMDNIHEYLTEDNYYTIVILAGKNGDLYPRAQTPGGFDQYGTYDARPNPNDNPDVVGDEYIITLTLDNFNDDWDNDYEHFGTQMVGDDFEPQASEHQVSNLNITINGEDLEWHELSDEASHFTFAFGNAEMIFLDGNNLTFTRENNKIIQGKTTNSIQMEYDYTNDTVTLHMHTNPSEYIESLIINNHEYNTPKTQEELTANFYRDMLCISFDIEGIPVRDTYNIVINAVHLDAEHQLTGGFGWNYSKDGDVDEASDRIPNGKIEFVKAVYNGVTYTSVSEFKNANRLFEWVDGEKKEEYPIGDRSQFGYTFFPNGATVTIKIIPDAGYQLVGLRNSGSEFVRENEPGVYTFVMHGGSAALGANFEPVNNEVKPNADRVSNGAISNVEFQNGTAKLEVNNVASMSPAREAEFIETAGEYEIDNYLEISLYNTIYKGGAKDDNNNYLSWDTEVNNLEKNVIIELEIDDLDGNDFAVIHEGHNNNNEAVYEVIPAQYNSEDHILIFETDSFSTYAIATKGGNNSSSQNENQARVIYNTRSDDVIEDAIINKGEKAPVPRNPIHEDGLDFEGWFTTEACNEPYDFDQVVNVDQLEIFAKWASPEEPHDEGNKDTPYVVKEGDNEISFMEEAGHTYHFEMIDYLAFSKEEVMEKEGITSEMYDQVFGGVKSQAEKKGTFLFFLNIRVYENVEPDPTDPEDDGIRDIHDGPFTVKIKITDELKKYKSFKMYYVKEDFTLDNEAIEFKVSKDGNYIVGTLKHLSPYVLVGSTSSTGEVPQTGDNIGLYVTIFVLSLIGLGSSILVVKKRFN